MEGGDAVAGLELIYIFPNTVHYTRDVVARIRVISWYEVGDFPSSPLVVSFYVRYIPCTSFERRRNGKGGREGGENIPVLRIHSTNHHAYHDLIVPRLRNRYIPNLDFWAFAHECFFHCFRHSLNFLLFPCLALQICVVKSRDVVESREISSVFGGNTTGQFSTFKPPTARNLVNYAIVHVLSHDLDS